MNLNKDTVTKRITLKKNYYPMIIMLILFLIFLAPILFSVYFYYFTDLHQFKTNQHGKLIQPVVNIKNIVGADNKWKMIYVPAHCCDTVCEQTMFSLHQLKKLLNKDSERLSLLLAVGTNCKIKNLHEFTSVSSPIFSSVNQFYLVDPKGNLIMTYSSNSNGLDLLKDIKHLFEVSQIG